MLDFSQFLKYFHMKKHNQMTQFLDYLSLKVPISGELNFPTFYNVGLGHSVIVDPFGKGLGHSAHLLHYLGAQLGSGLCQSNTHFSTNRFDFAASQPVACD